MGKKIKAVNRVKRKGNVKVNKSGRKNRKWEPEKHEK